MIFCHGYTTALRADVRVVLVIICLFSTALQVVGKPYAEKYKGASDIPYQSYLLMQY